MDSREQRIATLATTLRSSGIAKSDSQAKMMAEDMIGVEEHVQKDYEVEHTRAHEYLQTAKNLGDPRKTVKVEPVVSSKPESIDSRPISRKMEELYTSKKPEESKIPLTTEHTNVSFGGKTLNQAVDHDTHNSALEAIKAQISRKEFKSVDDIVPDSVVPQSMLHEDIEIVENLDSPVDAVKVPLINPVEVSSKVSVEEPVLESIKSSTVQPVIEVVDMPPVADSMTEPVAEVATIPVSEPIVEPVVEKPALDAQKLVEMMEEDGKLEEHTREIKEKPSNSKPKEAYEENNIDLSHMFDFNKGMVRK